MLNALSKQMQGKRLIQAKKCQQCNFTTSTIIYPFSALFIYFLGIRDPLKAVIMLKAKSKHSFASPFQSKGIGLLRNEKKYIKSEIVDYDAVFFYPSAIFSSMKITVF
jgi:NRPS condensation-like uncharacterized protein